MLNCLFVKTQKSTDSGAGYSHCESDSKDLATLVVGYVPEADAGAFRYGLYLLRFI